MNALNVVIVDDEELARSRLRTLLGDCVAPSAIVVAEFVNSHEALHWLTTQHCDVVLLDIHMPGLDGLLLAERLRSTQCSPAIVFVTAHSEHALDAFAVNAIDYLTKPVRRARLQEALARVALSASRVIADREWSTPSRDAAWVSIRSRDKVVRLRQADILYLKAEAKYVIVRTREHQHVVDDSLIELEKLLGDGFMRIHRNAIVSTRYVTSLQRVGSAGAEMDEGWVLGVAYTDDWLRVSRRRLVEIRNMLSDT